MADSGCLTEGEMGLIFVNWKELIMSNTKLLKWVLVFSSRVFVCMCMQCLHSGQLNTKLDGNFFSL